MARELRSKPNPARGMRNVSRGDLRPQALYTLRGLCDEASKLLRLTSVSFHLG
jgi:hypothetical protein